MTSRHLLTGCRPEPIGSYLAALGVLRLVGEQADGSAAGGWDGDAFALRTALDRSELLAFLLDRYRPTPLVSPWNGGSGFASGDKKAAAEIACLEQGGERLTAYRETLDAARAVLRHADQRGWSGKSRKAMLVQRCRATFPDASLPWLDAAVVLTGEDLAFPTLLGTGGNLGRLELSANFMARLNDVLCLRSGRNAPDRARSDGWLRAALFGEAGTARISASTGQFDPGAASSAVATTTGADKGLVNPWSFVLALEGALLFASAAARRMSATGGARAAMPFMVDASPVGYGTASDERSRGEIWAPLWSAPATARELAQLLGEGRATWGARRATTGLTFTLAAHSLGVDRGIDAFARHAVVERKGQDHLVVPVGRVAVTNRPRVPLLARLDRWLDAARRAANPPQGIRALLRRVDAALFDAARRGDARALQDMLVACAVLERGIGDATRFRERGLLRPLPTLDASEWLPHLEEDTSEFRLAAALATMGDAAHRLRFVVGSVAPGQRPGQLRFSGIPAPVPGLGHRPVTDVLASALRWRAIEAQRERVAGDDDPEQRGVLLGYRAGALPRLADVLALLHGRVDLRRLGELVAAFLPLGHLPAQRLGDTRPTGPVPTAFAVLAPFLTAAGPLRAQPGWPAALAAGRLERVLSEALLRLRLAGLDPAVARGRGGLAAVVAAAPPPAVLAAALLVPLPDSEVRRLRSFVCPKSLKEEA